MTMTIKELKETIKNLDDDLEIMDCIRDELLLEVSNFMSSMS